MKASEPKPGLPDPLLARLEASVAVTIRGLFARCPTLHGFSVQDRTTLLRELDPARIPDADLFVTEIGIFPRLGTRSDEIYEEIKLAISNLVKDEPHAYDLLRGRTFARSLH